MTSARRAPVIGRSVSGSDELTVDRSLVKEDGVTLTSNGTMAGF